MRRILGGLFEVVHLLAAALLLGASVWLSALAGRALRWEGSGVSGARATRIFEDLVDLVAARGPWVAGAALVAAVIAPYARGDGRILLSWLRILCAAAALVVLVYAGRLVAPGTRAGSTAWDALFVATALDLTLAAFQVTGGPAAKKAKGEA